jgi:hypothetical protein
MPAHLNKNRASEPLMNPQPMRLSAIVDDLVKACAREDLTVGEFLNELNVYGHMLVCLMFAVPFLFPAPLPGVSTIFGFVICVVAIQIVMGWDPWLPASWKSKRMPGSAVRKIFSAMSWVLKRIEKIIKPRLLFITRSPRVARVNGAIIFVVSLLLALPMPPGFNAPPALAIVLLASGSIEHDGFMILTGYFISAVNILLFGTFFIYGFEGLKSLINLF